LRAKRSDPQTFFSFYTESRQDPLYFEKQARLKGHRKIAGVDEAGRGPLAGPLVVAACILPQDLLIDGVDDSKKLSPAQRRHFYNQITSHPKIVYSIEVIEHSVIDEINILQATFLGMRQAIEHLSVRPDYILVDGSMTPFSPEHSLAIVQGDSLSHSIACASILAKVTRDSIMEGHDLKWPGYGFAQNKGYPTPEHLKILRSLGPSPIHRVSYAPVREVLETLQEANSQSSLAGKWDFF
jgi:ribonuclease HII